MLSTLFLALKVWLLISLLVALPLAKLIHSTLGEEDPVESLEQILRVAAQAQSKAQ